MTSESGQRQRATRVFDAIGLEPDGWGPGGRYPFVNIGDGLRLWVTIIQTESETQFGIQFREPKSDLAERLWPEFERCGFRRRNLMKSSNTRTFYRLLAWSGSGAIDPHEAMLVRRAIEGILAGTS